MSTGEEDAWAQLVCLTDLHTDPVMISQDKFVIGRAKDCDLSLSENKLVSGRHCYLERDSDGKVWLVDSSTNGTLLNLNTKISKGNRKELKHGDEFYIVYKKNEEGVNVGYVYQNMADLQSELEETQEYSTDVMDATFADDDCNLVEEEKKEEKEEEKKDSMKEEKKESMKEEKKDSATADEPPAKKMKTEDSKDKDSKKIQELEKDSKTKESEKAAPSSDIKDVKAESESNKGPSGDTTVKSSQPGSSIGKSAGDNIEEILICMICQEIMHDCVSLQPCMHTFCSGCYSDWMGRSSECPTCRMQVDRINKNHIVNNLIEAYLKEHPDKKRPDEDIAELDKKNKITKDMLYPTKKRTFDPDESDYSDSDDEEDEDFDPSFRNPAPVPVLFGIGNPVFGTIRAVTKCRQCPGYVDPQTVANNQTGITGMATAALNAVKNAVGLGGNQAAPANATVTAGTSTEATADSQATEPSESVEAGPSGEGNFTEAKKKDDEKVMPDPPAYTCGVNQNHVLCQCCLQPMPDRRHEYLQNPDNPNNRAQQCTICYRAYCHGYWGCKKAECLGCIGKFKDMVFGRKVLNTLVLDNTFESEILKDYMDSKHITVNELRDKCMENLDNRTSNCRDQARYNMTSNTPLCYACALRNFKDLAYSYRASIDRNQLPEKVTKRPDCYWGKNCRTQKNKPHHAQNFSHICEQTRTS